MFGKLNKVDLREIWRHEALDFTTWLAKEENTAILSEEIGLDFYVIETEATVGSFSVDILAEEENTGNKIIIENQLETTDHDHLGKLITYASGLEAEYIIWIFKDIREEHRQAIDWLNEITRSGISFFAIQMEVWKIGDSLPAPKFNVISSPNNWAKAVRASKDGETLSESNLFQLEFWEGLSTYLKNQNSFLKPRKPRAQHWYDFAIGTSEAHLAFIVSVKDDFIRCDFYINNNKALFKELEGQKDSIEKELGFSMDWQELPNAKASRIAIKKSFDDVKDENNINSAYAWFMERGEKIASVFKSYL